MLCHVVYATMGYTVPPVDRVTAFIRILAAFLLGGLGIDTPIC